MSKKNILNIMLGCSLLFINACSNNDSLSGAEYSQAMALGGKAGTYKVGNPYKILGKWYYPAEDYSYTETGVSSWYGEDFHAKYTANGEIYNMNTLTAAHRTLPLPSIVRVTNLENGRSVILRVNDRGPFAKDRIIDVSKKASQILGFQAQGTTKVKVELLEDESKRLKAALTGDTTYVAKNNVPKMQEPQQQLSGLTPTSYPKGSYFVQAGAYSSRESAVDLSTKLDEFGKSNVYQVDVAGKKFYRVRLGPFSHETEAKVTLNKVHYYGILEAKLVKD